VKRRNQGIQFHPVPWLGMSGAVPSLSHKSQHAQGQFYLHFCIMNCYGLSPFSFVSLDLEDAHGPPSLFHFCQITVSTHDTGKPIAGNNFLPFSPHTSIYISLFL
jgi:hypothetical protein